MNYEKIYTIVVFAIVYAYLGTARRYRAGAVWAGVLALAVGGIYCAGTDGPFLERLLATIVSIFGNVNWTVIAIFSGMMVIAEMFTQSKVPLWLSDIVVERSGSVGIALVLVCALASIVSAFVDNTATVLIIAPLVFELAQKLKISPIPALIGVAISSNLQGMATLTGDPPSMLLATHMDPNMSFNDFFWYGGRPGIFFAVQVGAVFSLLVLYVLFYRRMRQRPSGISVAKVTTWLPTWVLAALIASLAALSLASERFQMPGPVCLVFAFVLVVLSAFKSRAAVKDCAKAFDWRTILLLMGIFVVVGAIHQSGLTADIAGAFGSLTGKSVLGTFCLLIVVSVVLSAFIDNIPYVMLMLPVTTELSKGLGLGTSPLLAFGLLIGACLGGNMSPLGASANIVAVERLRREGLHVNFLQFAKMGVPFTIAATIPAAALIWFLWRP